jgi:hypothetical protein
MAQPKTTLDADITKPAQTEPGDGPADTTDPLERASTVTPQPSPETIKSGAGTVNGQLPLEPIPAPTTARRRDDRVEEYQATDANGKTVTIQRNVETGERRVKSSTDTGSTPTQSPAGR